LDDVIAVGVGFDDFAQTHNASSIGSRIPSQNTAQAYNCTPVL
jgi:hypothetical protein